LDVAGAAAPHEGHGTVSTRPWERLGSRRATTTAVTSVLTAMMTRRANAVIARIAAIKKSEPMLEKSEESELELFPFPPFELPLLLLPFPLLLLPLEVTLRDCEGALTEFDGLALSVTWRPTCVFPLWLGEHWKLCGLLSDTELGAGPTQLLGRPFHWSW
jgi:hypothetical protein